LVDAQIGPAPADVVFDARGRAHGECSPIMSLVWPAADNPELDRLTPTLRPLAFGAAYKVLDLLISDVLRQVDPDAFRRPFAVKRELLAESDLNLPFPLDRHETIWEALV